MMINDWIDYIQHLLFIHQNKDSQLPLNDDALKTLCKWEHFAFFLKKGSFWLQRRILALYGNRLNSNALIEFISYNTIFRFAT